MSRSLRVAVAGLGSAGSRVAAALDRGIGGLVLSAVSAHDLEGARRRTAEFHKPPAVVPVERLAEMAEVVVECLPPELLPIAARPILEKGGTLVPASVGALLQVPELMSLAARHHARILIPSGAIAGLDGLRAAAESGLNDVCLITRKPPRSFGESLLVGERSVPASTITEAVRLFAGSAREAIRLFPNNVNVAATISLAGLGPDKTRVEIWADPTIGRNQHCLSIKSPAGELTVSAVNLPDPANPKTSAITASSIVAALRRLVDPVVVGS